MQDACVRVRDSRAKGLCKRAGGACQRCGSGITPATTHVFWNQAERRREAICESCHVAAGGGSLKRPTAELERLRTQDDDSRWNRIFAKFEDPFYYGNRVPSAQSSFGAFAGRMEMLCRG